MATAVRYLRRGTVVAETTVQGRLLPLRLPPTVTMTSDRGAVDLVELPDPLKECCGRLTLVAIDDEGELHVANLSVPPPEPFVDLDLRAMWEARNRLDVLRRPDASGDADWSEIQLEPSLKARLEALPAAILAARSLLQRWPTRPAVRLEALPIARRGGRVDVRRTAHLGARAGVLDHAGRQLPARTVRRFGAREQRTCGSVSTISELLRARADAIFAGLPGIGERERRLVLAPLGAVAERSALHRGTVDGPPSTWPTSMQSFYSKAATALTEIEIVGGGSDTSPLSELWDLYQAWVAERILTQVSIELGAPSSSQPRRGLLGRWVGPTSEIELHFEPRIPARLGASKAICGRPVNANIGALRPDVVIANRAAGSDVVRMVVVDPKKRPYIDPSTLAVEASKYLWGIEGATVDRVVLVAPSGGVSSGRPSGRASTVTARPGDPLDPAHVRTWLDAVQP